MFWNEKILADSSNPNDSFNNCRESNVSSLEAALALPSQGSRYNALNCNDREPGLWLEQFQPFDHRIPGRFSECSAV